MTGARPFYDLTNPVIFQRDEATTVDTDNPKVPIRKIYRPGPSFLSRSLPPSS